MRTLKYNVKIEKIPFPLLSLLLVCEKHYKKKHHFFIYIYFKIHFKMCYYTDLNVKTFPAKMTALSI